MGIAGTGLRERAGWRSIKDDVNLKMKVHGKRITVILAAVLLAAAMGACGQEPAGLSDQAAAQPPAVITLEEAIHRAQSSEANYAAAVAEGRSARLDRNIAYAGLLPSVTYNNSLLYTEPQRPYSKSSSAPGSLGARPRFTSPITHLVNT